MGPKQYNERAAKEKGLKIKAGKKLMNYFLNRINLWKNYIIRPEFGGSSVANIDRIKVVAKRSLNKNQIIISSSVVSAMGDTTDELKTMGYNFPRTHLIGKWIC